MNWNCDLRAAFQGSTAAMIDVIAPVLRTAHADGKPWRPTTPSPPS